MTTPRSRLLTGSVLAATVLAAGCATTTHYHRLVHSWVNHDHAQLEQAWGAPDASEKESSGLTMLVYARVKKTPVDAEGQPAKISSPSEPLYVRCATYFETDQSDKIVNAFFEGDDCSKMQ